MTLKRMLRPILFCITVMFIQGCASTSDSNPFIAKQTTRKQEPAIDVNIAAIHIINDYLPYGQEPYVDHKLSPLPSKSLEEWLERKVKATGTKGRITLRIQEASLRWRKRPGKLRSMRYWPYRAIIRLTVEQYDENGDKIKSFPIQVMRVREIHEGFMRMPNHSDWWRMFKDIQHDLVFELRRKLPLSPAQKQLKTRH